MINRWVHGNNSNSLSDVIRSTRWTSLSHCTKMSLLSRAIIILSSYFGKVCPISGTILYNYYLNTDDRQSDTAQQNRALHTLTKSSSFDMKWDRTRLLGLAWPGTTRWHWWRTSFVSLVYNMDRSHRIIWFVSTLVHQSTTLPTYPKWWWWREMDKYNSRFYQCRTWLYNNSETRTTML